MVCAFWWFWLTLFFSLVWHIVSDSFQTFFFFSQLPTEINWDFRWPWMVLSPSERYFCLFSFYQLPEDLSYWEPRFSESSRCPPKVKSYPHSRCTSCWALRPDQGIFRVFSSLECAELQSFSASFIFFPGMVKYHQGKNIFEQCNS